MRRIALFIMAALAGVAASAQGLLDCIEPDVLRALLLQGQGDRPPVITGAVPAELSTVKMPGQLTWIGSAERVLAPMTAGANAMQVTAAWRSALGPDAARATAIAALAAAGWEVRALPGIGFSVFGSVAQQASQPVCRDGGTINVSSSVMDGITYVLLMIPRGNATTTTCSQPARPAGAGNSPFQPYLPHLQLPVDPATGEAARLGSSGGGYGGNSFSARTEFTTTDSVGNVGRHFAKQMAEQGWSSDANWSGAATAGSSWSKRVEAGVLRATLSLTAFDERQLMAVLHIGQLQ